MGRGHRESPDSQQQLLARLTLIFDGCLHLRLCQRMAQQRQWHFSLRESCPSSSHPVPDNSVPPLKRVWHFQAALPSLELGVSESRRVCAGPLRGHPGLQPLSVSSKLNPCWFSQPDVVGGSSSQHWWSGMESLVWGQDSSLLRGTPPPRCPPDAQVPHAGVGPPGRRLCPRHTHTYLKVASSPCP